MGGEGGSKMEAYHRVSFAVDAEEVEKRRALIVDDEPTMLRIISKFLEDTWDVDTARNARQALELIESNDYDMVITDYNMPGCHGVWLLEEIKHRFPHIHRVLHSGSCPEDFAEFVKEGVIQQFISKPSSSDDFKDLLLLF